MHYVQRRVYPRDTEQPSEAAWIFARYVAPDHVGPGGQARDTFLYWSRRYPRDDFQRLEWISVPTAPSFNPVFFPALDSQGRSFRIFRRPVRLDGIWVQKFGTTIFNPAIWPAMEFLLRTFRPDERQDLDVLREEWIHTAPLWTVPTTVPFDPALLVAIRGELLRRRRAGVLDPGYRMEWFAPLLHRTHWRHWPRK